MPTIFASCYHAAGAVSSSRADRRREAAVRASISLEAVRHRAQQRHGHRRRCCLPRAPGPSARLRPLATYLSMSELMDSRDRRWMPV